MAGEARPTCQANFEQGIAFALHLWPALTLAVQNHWGGPDSEDKRDWFAGAIVDLFPDLSKPKPTTAQPSQGQDGADADDEPEQFDVETVLVQVMQDEFEVSVDDDSAFETAEQIMRMRAEVLRGKFDEVDGLRRRWEARKGSKVTALFTKAEDQDDDTDWDTDEDGEDEDGDGDVEMGDAQAAPPREKAAPEVDEDGFTTVTRKKR
ncbi:pre-rRNA-processing protein TSR2 [Thozetella sp. PMI_491]|nr:pre-rRNA-processing protein TSR2 [Thozetella sp. PMI_491]